ncbi:putative oxidoreductase [Catalinimonas alkaloidigena]|uniref:Putative oxidoreductase n=1 Tax=Catalinimonas alkaloidigena TaxID=1075417 RepID=A0A1G9K137_9BACT|nr:DoxX family protein [Catalinimonas alkaloidigena]SDL43035.1 putative oxidoreductase [Catalinimonas alkaloidigena]
MNKLFASTPSASAVHVGLLLLRLTLGGLVLTHGFPKFTKLLSGDLGFMDPIGLGAEFSFILVVIAEFLCALLVLIGLGTRLAAIPLIINFTVIFFIVHSADEFGRKELPLLFLLLSLILLITGSGRYSVDAALDKSPTSRKAW